MFCNDCGNDIKALKREIKRLRKIIRDTPPSLEALLRRRGLKVFKKEPSDDLLIPESQFLNQYYKKLHKYSFRLFLRDVIKFQRGFSLEDVTRYATREVIENYVAYLRKIGLIGRLNRHLFFLKKSVKSFGETLEWFFSEILKREFLMEATWGVRFKKPVAITSPPGGDYDVIAKFNHSILYAEVKSSPPKQIYQKEIKAFLDRIKILRPELSIFFMDTELRMKDKIVPMFEEELKTPLERIKKEIFHLENSLFIMNSGDSIIQNIETILSWYYSKKVSS
ncbi:MAG: hypothetical protein N2257_01185 [Thermodesulfovibrionales bacterium]|nr:hypothetical protein [Thermodesulfovibrionales bacterium]